MKSRCTLVFGLLTLALALAATPAVAQEIIIGAFEGPPGLQNAGTGAIGNTGWVVADSGVQRVDILVDGEIFGQARYGFPRPQVEEIYPGFPDSDGPGFAYVIDSTQFINGPHTVSARVVTNAGNTQILSGTQVVTFTNNTAILPPFGEINQPQRNAELYGTCSRICGVRPNDAILTPVSGWVLDLGVEIGDAGVGWVELMVDGVIYYNTRTACTFEPGLGLHQCYGLPRLDIENRFPFALDAPNSGFRFLLDIGDLLTCQGLVPGHHTITIRAGDISTQNANVDEFPVFFNCVENLPEEAGIIGYIESPVEGLLYGDIVTFQGWALALNSVSKVEVFVDGASIGIANFGVDSRPGVADQFPGYPDAAAPVWRLTYDSNLLSEGEHEVQVFVTDTGGAEVSIGERMFVVDNE